MSFKSVWLYFCYDTKVILTHQMLFCVYFNSLVLIRRFFSSIKRSLNNGTVEFFYEIKNVVKEMFFTHFATSFNKIQSNDEEYFVIYIFFRKLIYHWPFVIRCYDELSSCRVLIFIILHSDTYTIGLVESRIYSDFMIFDFDFFFQTWGERLGHS